MTHNLIIVISSESQLIQRTSSKVCAKLRVRKVYCFLKCLADKEEVHVVIKLGLLRDSFRVAFRRRKLFAHLNTARSGL